MAVFELNDLCYALRTFDEKLREHVVALDEKPGQDGATTLLQQTDAPAVAARKASVGAVDDKRDNKVYDSAYKLCNIYV